MDVPITDFIQGENRFQSTLFPEARLDRAPEMKRLRRQTVDHPFGTLKEWVAHPHFLTKTLKHVKTEMSLHVLAYNLKRVTNLSGTQPLIEAMRA
jgi:hypothetical protein